MCFQGIYIAPGFDLVLILKESNIPKIFAYGTYKINMWYTKKNEMFGCQSIVIEVKRSWNKCYINYGVVILLNI